ncbi:VapE domain-containing protein [Pleurocapsa sp. PCC 7319]|uniref:VapE domain-containing protein n=1 Tax=Pleurocapsa sp. PCC 7319 TaxID=118161 RepID=UPI0003499F4E|nr:VapE domain-containing protein [Pleurocapsa sp. PCC 7319]
MSNAFAPTIDSKHAGEWVAGSGVSEEIVKLNPKSIEDKKEIAKLLNWSNYLGSPGWYVKGVDLETGQQREFGQFKPNKPIQFPDGDKAVKYFTFPKGQENEVILLIPDKTAWEKIAKRYNVPILPEDIDESRLDKGFWKWIHNNPQIPIEVTEGAKKAGCLLANGLVGLCLTGVWNGKVKRSLKAIPTLAPFLANGRAIHLLFDSDVIIKPQVQEALKTIGYLAQRAGCIVGVGTWEYTEATKGLDDLVVNQGVEALEEVIENITPYKEWLKSISPQKNASKMQSRMQSRNTATAALLDYVRDKYSDRLRLNELEMQIELDEKQFNLERFYLHLAEHDRLEVNKTKAIDVCTKVAEENAYNPVAEYLDKVSRSCELADINSLSSRFFGTSDKIYDIFLKKTLIAAVARVYAPGCKHDNTLVLQGEQGIGKSTFFDILAGEWFGDSMRSGKDKDDLLILHKSWIQEWGEIDKIFSKRQAGDLKAFLSCRKDTFREPYARTTKDYLRHSIIVGSVNDSSFLVDSTGNRRYWVIPVEKKEIDTKRLFEERDAIWASAVVAYREGETWWLSKEEEKRNLNNNSRFQIIDEWAGFVADYIRHRTGVSISQVLLDVFDFELNKIGRREQMRVANILQMLNWRKVGQKLHRGKRQVVWEEASTIPSGGIAEVLQAESQSQQSLSIPTIPTTPNSQTRKLEVREVVNSENINSVEGNRETRVKPIQNEESIPTAIPVGEGIDRPLTWSDYPHPSKDEYTIKNRARKVVERMFACSTKAELINLYACGKITAAEVLWLRENYLASAQCDWLCHCAERNRLTQIEKTEQGNIFNQNQNQNLFLELKEQITHQVRRLG